MSCPSNGSMYGVSKKLFQKSGKNFLPKLEEDNNSYHLYNFLVSLPYQVHIVFADYCVVRCTVSRNLSIRTMTVADYTRSGPRNWGPRVTPCPGTFSPPCPLWPSWPSCPPWALLDPTSSHVFPI